MKSKSNTCRYARKHTQAHASSYMSDCLLLRSTVESCDTAKCELCTCPLNDHRQPETPWRNNLVKFKAKQVHSSLPIPYPLPCVYLSELYSLLIWCLFFISLIQLCLGIPKGLPYFPSSTSAKFYLIDFQQILLVNPLSLSCLAYCADVRLCCRHCFS